MPGPGISELVSGHADFTKVIEIAPGFAEAYRQRALAYSKLGDAARAQATIARMGGDEFIVLLPETALPQAIDAALRLRSSIEGIPRLPDGGDVPAMTVSIGIATTADGQESLHDLLSRADQQLYRAKAGGRNRVCADDPTPESDVPPSPAAARPGGR